MHFVRKNLLWICIGIANLVSAQNSNLRFDHIGIEQGLSDSYVEDALQDEFGYVWIATAHGLNRFDGRNCKIYNAIGKDLLSLDHVNGLLIDNSKKLWICSRMNGILNYSFETETFDRIVFKDSNKEDFSFKNSIRQLVEDANKCIWAVNIYGIAKYTPSTKQWKWYTQSLDSLSLLRKYAFSITETPNNQIFVGFLKYGELFYYDNKNDGFRVFHGQEKNHIPLTKTITCLLQDSYNNLWYGSMESGLVCYNFKTGAWTNFKAYTSNDSLKSNHITTIFEDSQKQLWIGTINGGLSKFDRTNKKFTTSISDEMDVNSLSSNSISCIFEDKEKNLCITTHNGLNILNQRKNLFSLYGKTSLHNKVVAHNMTTSFYESPNGIIWIGTDGAGLQKFNPKSGEFTIYDTRNGLLSNGILDIEPNGDGKLWVATWGGGISLFNPQTETFKNFTPQNSGLNYVNVKGLYKDGDYLWIGTHGEGINIYDCKKNVFYNRTNGSNLFPFDLGKPIWINDITKDSYGNFWIYTTVGLFRFDGKTLHSYTPSETDNSTISGLHVKQVKQDSKGNIWIASNGLDLFIPSKNCFERMILKNKDLPRVVNSIEESADGKLWLSSNDGLYCYDRIANTVIKFNESDGIICNKFIERASLKTSKGILYFGGLKGFNHFNPLHITVAKALPSVHIRSCKTLPLFGNNNPNDIQSTEYIHNKTIEIPYSSSQILTFEFIAATLQSPELIHYSVKLIGFETVERELGEHTTVTYTNLPPGKYTLEVRASNSRGNEQSNVTVLHFEILTPWYMSWIFRIAVLLGIIMLIRFAIQYRTRLVERRNLQLTNMVDYRTQQLHEQKSLIEAKNNELHQTLQTRDKLLAIVSHDLKNPLSALNGLTTVLKKQIEVGNPDTLKDITNQICKSTSILQNQVITLLDWAISQSGTLQYEPQNYNLRTIVYDVVSLLKSISEQKNIAITIDAHNSKAVWCDAQMTHTIFRNIIGNSIKFTPKGGEIAIQITEKDGYAIVEITDNGIGIEADELEQLFHQKDFKVSYGTNNEKGIGLGLKICSEFISRNNGHLSVKSEVGIGTTFKIMLPLGNKTILYESSTDAIETIQNTIELDAKKIVLIVEDNIEIQTIIAQTLKPYFEIETAINGEIGLKKAIEIIPDIILSDIDMPVMNGRELCAKLKNDANTNHIPIVIISAYDSVFDQINGLKLGVDDYVTKPFDNDVLCTKVLSIIKNREEYSKYLRKQIFLEPENISIQSEEEEFLQSTIAIIEKNIISPDLTIDFIAQEIGMGRSQFYRKIKSAVGQTPVEFIRTYRLKKAAKLLLANRYRISEIAYDTGFSNPKYFANCFTEEYGISPTEYIKQHKNN